MRGGAKKTTALFTSSILLLAILTIISPNPTRAYAAPFLSPEELTISPTTGPSGTEVTVTGKHFFRSSEVSITFDGDPVSTQPKSISVKGGGKFSATFIVPDTGIGGKTIEASDNSIFSNSDSALFHLTETDNDDEDNDDEAAGIAISPTTGPSGTEVTVSGSHFSPSSTVSIGFNSDSVSTSPETIAVKFDGTFSAKFVVPDTFAGSGGEAKTVDASDSSIFRNSASAIFHVTGTDDGGDDGGSSSQRDSNASSQSISIGEDRTTMIRLRATQQSDDVRFSIDDYPLHGALSEFDSKSGTVLYSPTENYFGKDIFTFRVQGSKVLGTVSITIGGGNDIPTAKSQQVNTVEDTPRNITLSGSDAETKDITFSISDRPAHGKLTGTAPNLSYFPNKDYSGVDSFRFRTNDGNTYSQPGTISITVTSVNDRPIIDRFTNVPSKMNDDIRIILVASDSDSSSVSFSVVSGPEHGTLTTPLTTAPLVAMATYTPHPDYAGKDAFAFLVNDENKENGNSIVGKVNIFVGIPITTLAEPATGVNKAAQSTESASAAETSASGNQSKADIEYVGLQRQTASLDLVPPRLMIPTSDIEVQATSGQGAMVIYVTAAADDVDGVIPPLCSPQSGAVFPVGNITVRCSATDKAGNGVEKTFLVSVRPSEGGYPIALGSILLISAITGGVIASIGTMILVRRRHKRNLDKQSSTPSPGKPKEPRI